MWHYLLPEYCCLHYYLTTYCFPSPHPFIVTRHTRFPEIAIVQTQTHHRIGVAWVWVKNLSRVSGIQFMNMLCSLFIVISTFSPFLMIKLVVEIAFFGSEIRFKSLLEHEFCFCFSSSSLFLSADTESSSLSGTFGGVCKRCSIKPFGVVLRLTVDFVEVRGAIFHCITRSIVLLWQSLEILDDWLPVWVL